MPLAERVDYEDARFVGLAVSSCEPIAGHLDDASQSAGFDFLAIPLAKSLEPRIDLRDACSRMDFARQEMISAGDERPGSRLLGIVSPWIDPDSDDIKLRRASQIAMRSEVEWSKYLGLQAVALPAPHCVQRAAGYAQVPLRVPLDHDKAVGAILNAAGNAGAQFSPGQLLGAWSVDPSLHVCRHRCQRSNVEMVGYCPLALQLSLLPGRLDRNSAPA